MKKKRKRFTKEKFKKAIYVSNLKMVDEEKEKKY